MFTCLVTRSVHIEIAHDLSSDSFLMALHRFMARRGKPVKIFSDNGTNFKSAEKELRESIQQINNSHTKEHMLLECIEWHFIPPHAPHMGRAWERLIRSIKTILRSLVKDGLLTDEQLLSFIAETEKIMNDRPITKVSSDPKDHSPLTPNHLLLLHRNNCQATTGSNYVQRRWQVIHQIANDFYKRFVREYLPTLQQRNKWQVPQEDIRVNDIVLVVDETSARGDWPLGIVTEVNNGRDGFVRSAKVKVGDSFKLRPVTKLIQLEHHD